MAGRKQAMSGGAVTVVAVLVVVVAAAMASTAGADGMCGLGQGAVDACRSYCTVGSTEERPSRDCCAAVAGADFNCLCRVKGYLRSVNNIDGNRAMEIPSRCNIRGAPTSCK